MGLKNALWFIKEELGIGKKKIICFKCKEPIEMSRKFWEAMREIPDGLVVIHKCGAVLFCVAA